MLMVMRWNSFERRADEVDEVTVKIGGDEVAEVVTGVESGVTGVVEVEGLLVGVDSDVVVVIEQRREDERKKI